MKIEEEWRKPENQKILSYLKTIKGLSREEIEQLQWIALWKAIKNFNHKKSAFKTHLYNHCRYVYLDELKRLNKNTPTIFEFLEKSYNSEQECEILELLPDLHRQVFQDKYIMKLNIYELMRKHSLKKDRLNSIIEEGKLIIQSHIMS